jgi:hypothetical protein
MVVSPEYVIYARYDAAALHSVLEPELPSGAEMEWLHTSMVHRDRSMRPIVRRLPGFIWLWSRIKPFVRNRP